MTRLRPTVALVDVSTGATVFTAAGSVACEHTQGLDGAGHGSISPSLTQAESILTAVAADAPLLVAVSFDGAAVDFRTEAEHVTLTHNPTLPAITLEADDLTTALSGVLVDRQIAAGSSVHDILTAAPGTFTLRRTVNGVTTSVTPSASALPNLKGIYQFTPGLDGWATAQLQFVPVIDKAVANVLLDGDIDEDNALRATDLLCRRLAGLGLDGGTAGPTARGHYTVCTGDAASNSLGVARSVAIGRIGTATAGTFTGDGTYGVGRSESTGGSIQRGFTYAEDRTGMVSAVTARGGQSNHGLPASAKVTGCHAMNTGNPDDPAWDVNLLVISVYVTPTSGGLFYTTHDGVFRPFGFRQSFGATCSYVDEARYLVYAGTESGVWQHSGDPLDGSLWQRTGEVPFVPGSPHIPTFTGKVTRVWVDNSRVWALASGNGAGVDGLLTYPVWDYGDSAVNTAESAAAKTLGRAGWSNMVSNNLVAAGAIGNYTYTVVSGDTTKIKVDHQIVGAGAPQTIQIPGGYGVTAIVPESVAGSDDGGAIVGLYVLTSGGSAAMYRISGAGSVALQPLNADSSLQAQVQNIVPYQSGSGTIGGEKVALLACTDRGLYASGSRKGGSWRPLSPTGALADISVLYVAAGTQQTLLNANATRVYACNDRNVYVSHSDAYYFGDALADRLDLGPAFTAIAREQGFLPYPGQGIDTVTYGLPNGWSLTRRLGGDDTYTYVLTNPTSSAPSGAEMAGEVTSIEATAETPINVAAAALLRTCVRYLGENAHPQRLVTFETRWSTGTAAARKIIPTDKIHVTYAVPICGGTAFLNIDADFYVLSITKGVDSRGLGYSKVSAGSQLLTNRLGIADIGNDEATMTRHALKGRKK